MSNKENVFIYARKRGVSPESVRRVLAFCGAPPTLGELPPKWETYDSGLSYDGANPLRTRRVQSDYRDCSPEVAALAKDAIGILAAGQEPCFVFPNGGFVTWDGNPTDAWAIPCRAVPASVLN